MYPFCVTGHVEGEGTNQRPGLAVDRGVEQEVVHLKSAFDFL